MRTAKVLSLIFSWLQGSFNLYSTHLGQDFVSQDGLRNDLEQLQPGHPERASGSRRNLLLSRVKRSRQRIKQSGSPQRSV